MRVFILVEVTPERLRLVRNYTGRALRFSDRMTAEVLADGLRHAGRAVDVIPTTEATADDYEALI